MRRSLSVEVTLEMFIRLFYSEDWQIWNYLYGHSMAINSPHTISVFSAAFYANCKMYVGIDFSNILVECWYWFIELCLHTFRLSTWNTACTVSFLSSRLVWALISVLLNTDARQSILRSRIFIHFSLISTYILASLNFFLFLFSFLWNKCFITFDESAFFISTIH